MLFNNRANYEHSFGNPVFADSSFCGLPPNARETLARIKSRKRFQRKSLIVAAGSAAAGVYILRAGQALFFFYNYWNRRLITRAVKTNEFFGLTEVIAELPYRANVVSITACLCEFIERGDFLRFLNDE